MRQLLLANAKCDDTIIDERSALQVAAEEGHLEVVKILGLACFA